MGKTVTFTIRQGTLVMRAANTTQIPAKVDTREFSVSIRSTITKKMRQLFKKLRDHSDVWRSDRIACFGPASAWERRERSEPEMDAIRLQGLQADKVIFEELDPTGVIEVELSGVERDALFWVCYFWVHPASPHAKAAGWQEEIAWPLIEQIAATPTMEEMIGIKKNEDIRIEYEDDEKPTPKVGNGSKGDDAKPAVAKDDDGMAVPREMRND